MSSQELLTIAPLVAAILVAAAIIVVDLVRPGARTEPLVVALVGLAIVAAVTVVSGANAGRRLRRRLPGGRADDAARPAVRRDHRLHARSSRPTTWRPASLPLAEFAAVLVFAMTGAMLISASMDLLVLFLGLELMVLPGYLLAGFAKRDALSTEGAIKYFLLGSFSSAIFLFGLSFVWGLTGSTRIAAVASSLGAMVGGTAPLSPGLAMGLAFLTTGVAFKIAAVPFHYWTPDAYQGSPTPVTGYLSVGPKIGAFALILRLFVGALGPLHADWLVVIVVLSTITMTLGNFVAITQDNVKRMLAYSSIAHTGYMLVGLAAWASPNSRIEGIEGLLFYGVGLQLHEPRRVRRRGRAPAPARGHEQHRHVRRARRAASPRWRSS